jgi:hypothetical protein
MASHPEFQSLASRFARCDVLSLAASRFADTPLADPARAALLLKRLSAMRDGSVVLPRIVHALALSVRQAPMDSPGVLWLAALGECLLEDDGECFGADVAAALVTDLIAISRLVDSADPSKLPHNGEEAPLWRLLASERLASAPTPSAAPTEGEAPVEGEAPAPDEAQPGQALAASFPRFLVRLSRRASVLRRVQNEWSAPEARVIERMTEASRLIWNHPPLASTEWQFFLLRSLVALLSFDVSVNQFPPGSGCSLLTLSLTAKELHDAWTHAQNGGPLEAEFARVLSFSAYNTLVTRISDPEKIDLIKVNVIPALDQYIKDVGLARPQSMESVSTKPPQASGSAPPPPSAQPPKPGPKTPSPSPDKSPLPATPTTTGTFAPFRRKKRKSFNQ